MPKTIDDFPRVAIRDYKIGDSGYVDIGSATLRVHARRMHNGGKRFYWLCNGCEQRVTALYLRAGQYRCRKCHGLKYRVQLESKKQRERRHAAARAAFNAAVIEHVRQCLSLLKSGE